MTRCIHHEHLLPVGISALCASCFIERTTQLGATGRLKLSERSKINNLENFTFLGAEDTLDRELSVQEDVGVNHTRGWDEYWWLTFAMNTVILPDFPVARRPAK